MIEIKIVCLYPDARLPEYQSDGAAGADLYAHVEEEVSVPPRGWVLIPTGLALEIPEGYQAEVRSRSGLALREGLFVLNGPGTIDSDYRGELKVILANFSDEPRILRPHDRIAQLIIMPVVRARFVTANIGSTSRNSGGFGSTGS